MTTRRHRRGTCYKRCRYCVKTISRWQASKRRGMQDKLATCVECKGARGEARRVAATFFPYRELTDDLVTKVRDQLEQNESVERRKQNRAEKLHRAVLRECKKQLQNRFIGREVEYEKDSGLRRYREGSGTVENVRIRDGHIEYVLDTKPDGLRRARLKSLELASPNGQNGD